MKTPQKARRSTQLTSDTQRRLIAYTAAAGLGAFLGRNSEGQVTQSQGLAPYPCTLVGNAITNAFSVDGAGLEFQFAAHGLAHSENLGTVYNPPFPPSTTNNALLYAVPEYGRTVVTNWWATIGGGTNWGAATNWFLFETNGLPNTNNFVLDPGNSEGPVPRTVKKNKNLPLAYGYPVPWTVGSVIDSNAWSPDYQNFGADMANGYHNTFQTNGAMGFTFFSPKSGSLQRYYGYMDIQITGSPSNSGFTVIITNMFYNAKPNAGITVGAPAATSATIKVEGISVGAGNSITINFTSSDNASASAFTLQKSASLGASASWTTDSSAVISSSAPGEYQAVTTGSGGILYYRINE